MLAYFDPEKELVLQVDSSKNGLGAVLLQNGKPIEFASRSLKPAKRNWAQIEKEELDLNVLISIRMDGKLKFKMTIDL